MKFARMQFQLSTLSITMLTMVLEQIRVSHLYVFHVVFHWLNDELKVDILMNLLYFGLACNRVWHENSSDIRISNETNK